MMQNLFLNLWQIPKITLRFMIKLYQYFISPMLGPRCRFHPSCSEYCSVCLERLPLTLAIWYSCKRVIKCHPFHPGGVDNPPIFKGSKL